MTVDTDTPRTPRALLTREQIAETLRGANDQYQHGANPDWSRWAHLANAVLALIDKENTMPDKPKIEPGLRVRDTRIGYEGKKGVVHSVRGGRVAVDDGSSAWSDVAAEGFWSSFEPDTDARDDTIPVPRALIEAAVDQIHCSALASELADLLDPPKPPAPRLRVVNLDEFAQVDDFDAGIQYLVAQPDLLTTLDTAIDGYPGSIAQGTRDRLKDHIRDTLTKENS